MTKEARRILKEALKLPTEARANLVDELQVSLFDGVDPEVEAAWGAEIERRVRAIESGTAKPIPWSEVRRKLWRRLRGPASR